MVVYDDDIFDVREGRLLCTLFRTVSANAYSATTYAADDDDDDDDDGRNRVKLRWAAYTDRQRRALWSLLAPTGAAAAASRGSRDVHVYNLSVAEGTPAAAAAAAEVDDEETTKADKETNTADRDEAATTTGPPGPNVVLREAKTPDDDGDGDQEGVEEREKGDDKSLRRDRRGCMDLKGLARLRRLCCMLRANVVELLDAYESRLDGGGGPAAGEFYTAAEREALDGGLRELREDVWRLVGEVHDATGRSSGQLADVVAAYKTYESRYRALRALNKDARLRAAADAATAAAEEDVWDAEDANALGTWIKRYLCDPCSRLFRQYLSSEERKPGRA